MTNPHFFLVRWLKQVYCLSIPSASARRQLRESEPVWSSPSDAQPGLATYGLGDLGFLTVVQLSIVVAGAQVFYIIAASAASLRSPTVI